MLLYPWNTNKIHLANQINLSGNILLTDQKELFTLFRTQRVTERLKTTPCPVAHFRLGQTREYPPGGEVQDNREYKKKSMFIFYNSLILSVTRRYRYTVNSRHFDITNASITHDQAAADLLD